MSRPNYRPASLAQHFDAPEGYIGHFGWMCGYSADSLFLNDAAERFTRLTKSQRAYRGSIALAVMLDPGNLPISLQEAPGVAHLPIKTLKDKPFRLLHAKVALLGFRHQDNQNQWQLRLLVSTGNWTRQTLEESLDLIWRIDISSDSINKLDGHIRQACSDLKAAWDFLVWIQNLFDLRLLGAAVYSHISETTRALQQVSNWINISSKKAQGKPRFFDNRQKSLLAQLPKKVKGFSDVKRNYLAMGSGFYEAPLSPDKPPEVLVKIVKTLQLNDSLTNNPTIDVYVNPMACQSIATTMKPLQECGFSIRPAALPKFVFDKAMQCKRTLHAKFLFSSYHRGDSNTCSSAWVYLGSGNLTNPGFINPMSSSMGNLEAGVVFAPGPLFREEDTKRPDQDRIVVTNLLPIQWEEKIDDEVSLSAGSEMEDRDTFYITPPVAWLTWSLVEGVGELRSSDPVDAVFQVLDSTGNACLKTDSGIQWNDAQPRQVLIRWYENDQIHELLIPVIDQYGRIAATELPLMDMSEAWWQLASFPLPLDEDDTDGDDENSYERQGNAQRRSAPMTTYPIREMMEFIEGIAAKQTEIEEMDWVLWCNRLEQILAQAGNSEPVQYFRDKLNLNPLSPLFHCSFRPSFAETNDSELGKLYEDTLNRVQERWVVTDLSPIGGMK